MTSESAVQLAWRRFSRGLPSHVQSVEDALETGERCFTQWLACLASANHWSDRVHRSKHRRGSIDPRRKNVARRSLKLLSGGESLTAEQIAARIGKPHVDVVRRGLKKFLARGLVVARAANTPFEPRHFCITPRGKAVLKAARGKR
jgi:hypothetical protein